MNSKALNAELNLRTVIETFAPQDDVRHALFLTYNFDGEVLEDAERGLLEVLWQRNCENALVVRDGKALLTEKRSHRYSVINAAYSRRTFHPKFMLLLAPSEMLAVIGSANLTRGGLERNLELGGVYRLTRTSGPLSLFSALRDYLHDHLQRELIAASPQQRNAFDILVRDFDRFLNDARSARSTVEPLFLHNYDQPLLPQIVQALPDKRLDALWIVSPFFEPDPIRHQSPSDSPASSDIASPHPSVKHATGGDDPPGDTLDEALLEEIFRTFTFATGDQQPPIRIYFQTSTANATRLPLNVLQRFKSHIALYAKDPTAIDQRTLHAKMLVFIGRHRAGKPFVTVVYGSANFTRAALLSTPPKGNAEIVVVTQLPYADNPARKLDEYLNLRELFTEIHNWDTLICQASPPPTTPHGVQVWEGLVSLTNQTVTVFFHVDHPDAQRVTVTLRGDQPDLLLGEVTAPFPDSQEFPLPKAAIVTVNLEMGLQQLPYHCVCVEAFDANGQLLGRGEGALNVDCPGAFYGDWHPNHLWLDTLDTQIYLVGLGDTAGYAALRAHVERVLSTASAGRSDAAPAPSHQADLDLFFRRLHIGFRGLRRHLEQTHGSLYVFGDVLRQLARWAQVAVQGDEQYTTEQRLYLCERIVQTALECVEVMKKVGHTPEVLAPIVRDEFLGGAKPILDYVDELHCDENVGIAARNLLKQWSTLKFEVRGNKEIRPG